MARTGEQRIGIEPAVLSVEVWVDVASPWCYLAKRRLEQAIAAFERPGQVQVRYRGIEVGSDAEASAAGAPDVDVTAALRAAGLGADLARVVPGATFDAHRVVALALASGGPAQQAAALERLFHARFAEGRSVTDHASIQRLGAEAGLDERRLGAVLAGEQYTDDVLADRREAQRRGIDQVPVAVFGAQNVLGGRREEADLLAALRSAWQELDVSAS